MTGQSNNEQIQSQWARVRGKLRAEMGETAYKNWLKKLTLLQIRGQDVEMAVPTRFVRDWIVSHYQDRLRALWQGENPSLKGVEIIVDSSSLTGLGDGRPTGRAVEAETGPLLVEVVLRREGAVAHEAQLHDVPGHDPHQEEDEDRDAQQRRDHQEKPLDDVLDHAGPAPLTRPARSRRAAGSGSGSA